MMINRISTILSLAVLLSFLPFHSSAQEYDKSEYCPLTKGMYLKYANYDEDSKIKSYYAFEITFLEGTLEKGHIIFDQEVYDRNGEPLFKDNIITMDATTADGITTSRMSGLNRIMKTQDDFSKGDISSIPSELKVGMEIPDGNIKIYIDKFSASIQTRDRKVIDQKTITTKAGTFECYLLKETQITKTVGSKTELVETWYTKGIGTVKQTVYDKKGRLKQSQELISLSIRN